MTCVLSTVETSYTIRQRNSFAAAGLLVAIILAACDAPPVPRNIGEVKHELTVYWESGQHRAEIETVVAAARDYLADRIASAQKPAIVLDVDETALSNWTAIKANDFGFITHGSCTLPGGPCGLGAWIEKAAAPAVAPTLAFYQWARHQKVAVFFVTARPDIYRAATERNLHSAGYDGWTGLYLKSVHDRSASAADFKVRMRREIAARGYTIIENIGDQPSDLKGGYSERTFLLPNPFYSIP